VFISGGSVMFNIGFVSLVIMLFVVAVGVMFTLLVIG
jgi:hypothetical protein